MINIQKPFLITKIYLVENCYGDPNKVYIGKEKSRGENYSSRKSDHKKTFGREIIFTFIDEIDSLDKEIWKPLETFYIRYFKFLGFDVLNENEGGGGPSFYSEEIKLKMSETRRKTSKKIILQYDFEGNFLNEYRLLSDIIRKYNFPSRGNITGCCEGKYQRGYNFIWRYKDNPIKNFNNECNFKKIIQFDINNNFIKEWNNSKEIFNTFNFKNKRNIYKNLTENKGSAYGYKWRYKD